MALSHSADRPHIRYRFGVWSCVTMWPFICGCGYTAKDAYAEWERIRQEKQLGATSLASQPASSALQQ
jgi:hypothetical protein